MEREGLRSFSEVVRACLRQWYGHKYVTKFRDIGKIDGTDPAEKRSEDKMTDEQFCEKYKGLIGTDAGGGRYCTVKLGAARISIPITNRTRIEEVFNQNQELVNK